MKKLAKILVVLVVVLVAVGGIAYAALLRQIDQRVVGEYFDSDGIRIHYTDEGSGEPVILVHGFAANADMNWRQPGVIDALSNDYRVIAVDNRGHGLSDKPHDPEAYGAAMAEDIVRLMDHLGIEKAQVVGYSMGAFITLKLIAMAPERLISAAPCAAGWQLPDEENLKFIDTLATSLETGQGYGPLIARITPAGQEPNPMLSVSSNRVLRYANDDIALAAVVRGFAGLVVTEAELRANQVPTLSIVGSIDPLRDGIDKMTGVMANHEVIFVEDGDHISTVRDPRFLEALRAWLEKHGETSEHESETVAAIADAA